MLTRPWQGGIAGWIVVFGALIAELVGGVVVNAMSALVAEIVLLVPVALLIGFTITQWIEVQVSHADPARWWHLVGIAAGIFTWQAWPTVPGPLQTVSTPSDICHVVFTATPSCLARASAALADSHFVFWATGAVIIVLIALVRKSRIAAWSATPIALAGCQLSSHYLELLLLHFHAPGA